MSSAVAKDPQYYADAGRNCKCSRSLEQDQAGWYCPPCREASPDCTCPVILPPGASWRPVDLAPALDGGCIDEPPVLLARDDGSCLLYNGKIHTISGESESLKTWLVLLACVSAINAEHHVLFIDYEDSADSITRRLVALGSCREAILTRFHYVRPSEPYGPLPATVLRSAIAAPVAIAVIDGITEAMSAHGLDPLSNADVALFNARLPRPLADTGAIVVSIDHVTKSREGRGRYAIGAQHKLSAVDGAAYIVELVRAFGHGQHGIAKVIVAKDRPGRVQTGPGRLAGMLHLRSEPDGSVLASLVAPKDAPDGQQAASFRPTILMERVSKYVEANPGLSGRAIIAAVSGKTDHKKLALELLIADGFILAEKSGSSIRHKSGEPFRDSQPDARSEDGTHV